MEGVAEEKSKLFVVAVAPDPGRDFALRVGDVLRLYIGPGWGWPAATVKAHLSLGALYFRIFPTSPSSIHSSVSCPIGD